MSRAGTPIAAAYVQTGASSVLCPRCSAAAGEFCCDHHGRPTRVPHVQRCAAARTHGSLTEASLADADGASPLPVDFGEPRHPREGKQ